MSVTAKNLIASKFAANATTTEYTTPASTRTIIDRFTATNLDASAQTLAVYLVPSGSTAQDSNKIIDDFSINAGATQNFTELQNQILETGDFIACVASGSSMVVIRASGREVT